MFLKHPAPTISLPNGRLIGVKTIEKPSSGGPKGGRGHLIGGFTYRIILAIVSELVRLIGVGPYLLLPFCVSLANQTYHNEIF